jgi:hypothetical protein
LTGRLTCTGGVAVLLFLANGCTTAATLARIHQDRYVVPVGQSFALLMPHVNVIDAPATRSASPREESERQVLATWLEVRLLEDARTRRLRLGAIRTLSRSAVPFAIEDDLPARLVRANLTPDDAKRLLAKVCEATGVDGIMSVELTTRFGSETGYVVQAHPLGAFSFTPHVGTSQSHLRAALRECQAGTEVWRNELFFRTAAVIGSSLLVDAVNEVFANVDLR